MTEVSKNILAPLMQTATCPACGCHVAVPFYDGGRQPLATLAWPGTEDAARRMARLPLDFVSCIECGHVYNTAFDYADVPYSSKPNLMFNRGVFWADHLRRAKAEMLSRLPESPVVVEIGHGDGSFLAALAADGPAGRYVGFDPNGAADPGDAPIELRQALFEPAQHLSELRPDLIISRHVLEHLKDPLGFIQQFSFAAACIGESPLLYLEVPCIDRALQTGRTVDFYYEHSSHFTTESFTRMLERCAVDVERIDHAYDGEVIYTFSRLRGTALRAAHAAAAYAFYLTARETRETVRAQLAGLYAGAKRVAIWGGTGKSAAFIHRYGVDAARFPIVVDSDPQKAGTFVPGTGQEIRHRDWLLAHPVDVVIIPPQWRARDIIAEMARAGIAVESILIEHAGRLVDFHLGPHPYRHETAAAGSSR